MLPPGLRDANPGDRAALLDLWVVAWRGAMPSIDFEARRDWLDRHLDAVGSAGARTLVADVLGYGTAGFVTVDPRRRYVDQLAVHPDRQGRGLAGLLMAGAKALSPDGLDLEVNRDNERALGFYMVQGFRVTAPGRNPLSGLPTLLMHWTGGDRFSSDIG